MTESESLVQSLEPYLIPDSGSYEEAKPRLEGLVRPYELDPWRAYHNVRHLTEMTEFLQANEAQLHNPTAVFGAVLGHDSVYEPWLYAIPGANEELSLERTQYFLSSYYAPDRINKINSYIRATVDHPAETRDTDLAYFLDADMHILGADPDRFDEYEDEIYREFTWRGDIVRKQYLEGRLKFLKSIENKRIFSTEMAQDLYETRAHQNIGRMAVLHQIELADI